MKPVQLNDMSAFYLNCRHFLIRRLICNWLLSPGGKFPVTEKSVYQDL